ncbi:MAG: S8 family serine peptidase [Casimicrobium sp.]
MCGDASGYDASGIFNDKFGTCTGTSMAAPHITGLLGLVHSANPLLTYSDANAIVRNSGNLGYGGGERRRWDMACRTRTLPRPPLLRPILHV